MKIQKHTPSANSLIIKIISCKYKAISLILNKNIIYLFVSKTSLFACD